MCESFGPQNEGDLVLNQDNIFPEQRGETRTIAEIILEVDKIRLLYIEIKE